MKATFLLRQNIRALLRARGQKDSDLAQWCKKSRAWISKILAEDRDDRTKVRELNVRDLDRIADFFGLATYQLFQPGISPLTERRSGHDRRSGRDRRIGHSGVMTVRPTGPTLTADEVSLVARARQLKYEQLQHVSRWIDAALIAEGVSPGTTLPRDQPHPDHGTRRPARARQK